MARSGVWQILSQLDNRFSDDPSKRYYTLWKKCDVDEKARVDAPEIPGGSEFNPQLD